MPTRSKAATTVSETSELAGQKPSFTALPNWLLGKASALEIAVLWVLQSHYPEIRPSITRLAACANLSRRTVFNVLADLERKGWLVRVHREFESGKKAPNLYRLTIWDGEPKAAGDGAGDALVQEVHQGDGAPRARRMVQEMHHDGAPRAHEVDQVEEEQLEEQDSPSIPLAATAPAAPEHREPSPPIDQQADPAPKPSRKALKVTPADVPADLAPVADLFATWWNHHKGGQRTQRALTGQLGQLTKILADPRGGIEAVRSQLQKAITAAELGRRWAGITFDNWLEYGRPAALQVGNGSAGGYRTARERNEEKLDEWVEFIYATDPQYANHPRNQSRTTTATIDWEAMPRA